MNIDVNVTNLTLRYERNSLRCAIGKGGYTTNKCEGDGKTPLGVFPLRELWYRPDRVNIPTQCMLNTRPISPETGWCDDTGSPYYNRQVNLPFPSSHETLWLEDHRYDIIIPLGYNDAPPEAGKGSAIFFHLATEHYAGTEGCVAISHDDMMTLLPNISANSTIHIHG